MAEQCDVNCLVENGTKNRLFRVSFTHAEFTLPTTLTHPNGVIHGAPKSPQEVYAGLDGSARDPSASQPPDEARTRGQIDDEIEREASAGGGRRAVAVLLQKMLAAARFVVVAAALVVVGCCRRRRRRRCCCHPAFHRPTSQECRSSCRAIVGHVTILGGLAVLRVTA